MRRRVMLHGLLALTLIALAEPVAALSGARQEPNRAALERTLQALVSRRERLRSSPGGTVPNAQQLRVLEDSIALVQRAMGGAANSGSGTSNRAAIERQLQELESRRTRLRSMAGSANPNAQAQLRVVEDSIALLRRALAASGGGAAGGNQPTSAQRQQVLQRLESRLTLLRTQQRMARNNPTQVSRLAAEIRIVEDSIALMRRP